MLRETVRPANEIDAAIVEALVARTRAQLEPLLPGLPETVADFLNGVDPDVAIPAKWETLARALDAGGFTAAALAAYDRLAADVHPLDPNRARPAEAKAQIEERLRMDGAAAIDRRLAMRLQGNGNSSGRMPELEADPLYVLAACNDPDGHRRLIASLGDYSLLHDPLRDPVVTRRNFFGDNPGPGTCNIDDLSFFVLDGDGRPVIHVEADVMGARWVGCRESPIELTPVADSHPLIRQAEALAVRQLRLAAEWSGATEATFERRDGQALAPSLTLWINECHKYPVPVTAAWIDLSWGEEEIERHYRDAHRQSLRWGRRNIVVESTTKPDPRLLDVYDEVYAALGRQPGLARDRVAAYLEDGALTLYAGYYNERPVVALLSSRHGRTTYYLASAKLRIDNKPVGHVVLHRAIMDAKAEGQKIFSFGLLQEASCFSEKLRNIALYKRGFATHLEQRYIDRATP